MTKKKTPKKKKAPSKPRGARVHNNFDAAIVLTDALPHPRPPTATASARHSTSDSDSDYGSRSKKKKKPRIPSDEIRVSSRGTKVPNYIDDVQDFEQFDEEDAEAAAYIDPNAPQKEEDEIEMVLGHTRDEEHKDDAEDDWFRNIVRTATDPDAMSRPTDPLRYSDSTSNGRISRICTTPTRCTSS